ncbi:MAG: argininosuccinate lyase [Lachnospiraceae bacterium]|nr:argininosuccinate lyase [Lachnospiraceae bacterium]
MKLWGGRFTEETAQETFVFNASLPFDRRLYREDIEGSLAHAQMLTETGILTPAEGDRIRTGLIAVLEDLERGTLEFDETAEDIHSFVEAQLTARIGDAGKKLHTGRSRNDQVALDMRLFTRRRAREIRALVLDLIRVLTERMEQHANTVMPGFTHLQKAQPITLGLHLGAYAQMFRRDCGRLSDLLVRMNECPLGAGALAGTTYPLDRSAVAQTLGFDRPTANSLDSVSDRDYLLELLSALSILMMHLSRFCEEIILWNSDEYRFVEIPDAFATGSSIMPQKKNPDVAELVRGKTGRVYGDLMSLLTAMKGLPLAYNKDMQEDKEPAFDAMDTAAACLGVFTAMVRELSFREDVMEKSAARGFTNATDAADYLVKKGMPFRDAHGVIGHLVLTCIGRGISLDELPLEDFKAASELFDEDVYDAISVKTCVAQRITEGGPAPEAMARQIEDLRAWLREETPEE